MTVGTINARLSIVQAHQFPLPIWRQNVSLRITDAAIRILPDRLNCPIIGNLFWCCTLLDQCTMCNQLFKSLPTKSFLPFVNAYQSSRWSKGRDSSMGVEYVRKQLRTRSGVGAAA